jgi:hypothetical protein
MPIRIWAVSHPGADVSRMRAQGVDCPYPYWSPCVVVLSAMREAARDIYLSKAKLPIRQVSMTVPAESWDRWSIDLPPRLKELSKGKLDRVVMLFEAEAGLVSFQNTSRNAYGVLWSAL